MYDIAPHLENNNEIERRTFYKDLNNDYDEYNNNNSNQLINNPNNNK